MLGDEGVITVVDDRLSIVGSTFFGGWSVLEVQAMTNKRTNNNMGKVVFISTGLF